MKVDMHVHLLSSALLEKCADIDRLHNAPPLSSEETLTRIQSSFGAERILVQGWPFPDMERCRMQNALIQAAMAAQRSKIWGLCSILPTAGEAALQEAEHWLDAGFSGIGELDPCAQHFSLDDPAFEKLCQLCEMRGCMLSLYTGFSVGPQGASAILPVKVMRLIENHPDLRLLLPHYGSGLPFYALMPEVSRKLCNVWFDTAPDERPLRANAHACATLCLEGGQKLLFGSHTPLVAPTENAEACWDLPKEVEDLLV